MIHNKNLQASGFEFNISFPLLTASSNLANSSPSFFFDPPPPHGPGKPTSGMFDILPLNSKLFETLKGLVEKLLLAITKVSDYPTSLKQSVSQVKDGGDKSLLSLVLNDLFSTALPTDPLTTFAVYPVSSEVMTAIEAKLETWRNEDGLSDKEKRGRQIAATRVKACLENSENKLDLSHLSLSSLPDVFEDLSALTELDLSKNQLTGLSDKFIKLTSLQVLNLSQNKLIVLPKKFGDLTALIKLNLMSNNLDGLPKDFGNLIALTELNLECNKIRSLPNNFGNLKALVELNLNFNKIVKLSDSFANLTALKKLFLYNCGLPYLPLCIKTLKEQGTQVVSSGGVD